MLIRMLRRLDRVLDCFGLSKISPTTELQPDRRLFKRVSSGMAPIEPKLVRNALTVAADTRLAILAAKSTADADIKKIRNLLEKLNEKAEILNVAEDETERTLAVTGGQCFPLVFVKGDCVGGLDRLQSLHQSGVLSEWLKPHSYDLIVIGGGSGGLAAAKEAARLGKKVVCLDYVQPSPKGTTWGLGGTCVNVGCIPKKLMHQAALLGHAIDDAKAFGWVLPEGEVKLSWQKMTKAVQEHIASLNWGYRVQLREREVTYYNSYGKFVNSHELEATSKKGKVVSLSADRFLICTGLRPRYLEVDGAKQCCITSDDLFSLPYSPGKTLCVGASYVSLECAGFLRGFGLDVTVMVRSILLRGFDQDMAERIGKHMESEGVTFIRKTIPTKFEQLAVPGNGKPGRVKVHALQTMEDGSTQQLLQEYDTVVLAIGRDAVTDGMGLEEIGVERGANKKILAVGGEQSASRPYVYALGDVLNGSPELTPVAIQAGRVLMRRLYTGNGEITEYDNVATTVFTPLEYGCCGLSEEDAISKFGEQNIRIYHNAFLPLEYSLPHRKDSDHCYCKLICTNSDQKVVGLHILGPNAGEITQGFAISFKFGACKADFDRLIGIHPTVAETLTTLTILKSEQTEVKPSGC